jgi:hypothetical protein
LDRQFPEIRVELKEARGVTGKRDQGSVKAWKMNLGEKAKDFGRPWNVDFR